MKWRLFRLTTILGAASFPIKAPINCVDIKQHIKPGRAMYRLNFKFWIFYTIILTPIYLFSFAAGVISSLILISLTLYIFKKVESSPDYKSYSNAIKILTQIGAELGIPIFYEISKVVEKNLINNKAQIEKQLQEQALGVEFWIWGEICNLSADMLESGHFHVYRGVLSPQGQDLKRVFDYALNKQIVSGKVNIDRLEKISQYVLNGIRQSG